MAHDEFMARCHPHMLGEDGGIDLEQCRALAADMADLRQLGVVLTLTPNYAVGPYRYTNLSDALAQGRRSPLSANSL